MASPLRMLLRASVTSISRPVRPSRLPQTFARAYSQRSPLSDTPPPPPPPHTEFIPSPTPLAPLPSVPTLDFGMDEPAARVRTGAKSAKDSLSSIERRRRSVGWVSSGLLVTGLVGGYIYLGREPDEKIDVCLSLSWLLMEGIEPDINSDSSIIRPKLVLGLRGLIEELSTYLM
jgi:hypothetical protein